MNIGKALRQARRNVGVGQLELSRMLGRYDNFIPKIEIGKTDLKVDVLLQIAEKLEIKPGSLLDWMIQHDRKTANQGTQLHTQEAVPGRR